MNRILLKNEEDYTGFLEQLTNELGKPVTNRLPETYPEDNEIFIDHPKGFPCVVFFQHDAEYGYDSPAIDYDYCYPHYFYHIT